VSTTNMDTQIDVVFVSEEIECSAGTYDSYFSDHKAVYLTIDPSEMTANKIMIEESILDMSYLSLEEEKSSQIENKSNISSVNEIMIEESILDMSYLSLEDEESSQKKNRSKEEVMDISSDEDILEVIYNPKKIMSEISCLRGDNQFYQKIEIIIDKYRSYFNEIKQRHGNSGGFIYNHTFKNRIATNKNKKLEAILKESHNVIDITGDGNCLYNSLSFLLHGTELFASELRLLAILVIIEKREFFETMCEQIIEFSNNIERSYRLISLINDIATDGAHGNEGAIIAFCIGLERPIICVTPLSNQRSTNHVYGFEIGNIQNNAEHRPLYILLSDAGRAGAHYDALCPTSPRITNYKCHLIKLTELGYSRFY
jgi:OTU-like cysteine protease